MGKTVYLIGHGRVDPGKQCQLQPNTTMHWLAPLGDVTTGLSYAFLSGAMTNDVGTSTAASIVPEHYLCSDVHTVNDRKIKEFFERATPHPNASADPYLLMPRYKTNVSLSSILAFLNELSPSADWHVYWTCCRGYLGVANPTKTGWDRTAQASVQSVRVNPDVTPDLDDQGHTTEECGFKSVIMVAKSDFDTLKASSRQERFLGVAYSQKIHGILDIEYKTESVDTGL